MDSYVCHQFPDATYISDTIIVALITTAVLFPVSGILMQMMDLSNTVHVPFGWQETIPNGFLRVAIGGEDGHRSWHWWFPEGQRKSLIVRNGPWPFSAPPVSQAGRLTPS